MSLVINSNMTASMSALNLSRSNDLLRKSMLRLSSGKRIISPADDAGGLAVGLKLQSALRRTAATKQNIQNGVSYLQVQDGALKVVGGVLDRMAELRSMSSDITKNASDRQNYNYEFKELQEQLVELRLSKFNGVSLFSTTETDPELIKIITTEDGMTGKVDLNRQGLFENLKSKYGADGELNSGSHGSYRQLVGHFQRDGGSNDPMLHKASRNYSSGAVVYMDGTTDDKKGYFMALKNVRAGSTIEDTYGAGSNWIRLADKAGKGFAESFSEAPDYDPFSLKKSASGSDKAYLKGDVIKVPAHWTGGEFYMKAQQDVPYGMTLAEIFNDGHVGENEYFNYVGQDRSDGGLEMGRKPTTDFIRANSNHPAPQELVRGSAHSLLTQLKGSTNNTPSYVKVDASGKTIPPPIPPPAANFQVDEISNIFGDFQLHVMEFDLVIAQPDSSGSAATITADKKDSWKMTITDKDGDTQEVSVAYNATKIQTAADLKAALADSTVVTATVSGSTITLTGKDGAKVFDAKLEMDDNEEVKDASGKTITRVDSVTNLKTSKKQYTADAFQVTIGSGEHRTVSVDYEKDAATTAQALVDAINANVDVSEIVTASLSGVDKVKLTAKKAATAFYTILGTDSKSSPGKISTDYMNEGTPPTYDSYGTGPDGEYGNSNDTGYVPPGTVPAAPRNTKAASFIKNTLIPAVLPSTVITPEAYVDTEKKSFLDIHNTDKDGRIDEDGKKIFTVGKLSRALNEDEIGSAKHYQQTTISNIVGDVQEKMVVLKDIAGDEDGFDAFEVTITDRDGNQKMVSAQFKTDAATTAAFLAEEIAKISFLTAIEKDGEVIISGETGAGDFMVSATPKDNGGYAGLGTVAKIEMSEAPDDGGRAWKADSYTVGITTAGGVITPVTVDAVEGKLEAGPDGFTDTSDDVPANRNKATAQALVDKINGDAALSKEVTARLSKNGTLYEVTLTANEESVITDVLKGDGSLIKNQPQDRFKTQLSYKDVFHEDEPNATSLTPDPSEKTEAAQAVQNSEHVLVATPIDTVKNGPYDVYKPTQSDWGIKDWNSDYPFKAGELLLEESGSDVRILEMNANVKGNWKGGPASAGDFYFDASDKKWYKADVDITSANQGIAPSDPSSKWSVVESSPEKTVAEILGTDRTSDFADPVDSQYWTKTHFGNLLTDSENTGTETIGVNYERGDNILYKGKHYVYVDHLPSNEFSKPGSKFTEFEDLLTTGAVREASLYVDTKGGGGSADLPAGVFYRPNEELEHMDRLPNSGLARANSITRRANSSNPPGDDIFNSADDMFHGGLDAGNDGIYGTADDFYAATNHESDARKGFHVDGDADNNKDLLDAKHDLSDFSVADFIDYIQSLANFRAINGGTMSRLSYSTQMLEENQINLESAVSRIMDADMALEASKLARQNVLVQTGATMLAQANQLSNLVLSLLQ